MLVYKGCGGSFAWDQHTVTGTGLARLTFSLYHFVVCYFELVWEAGYLLVIQVECLKRNQRNCYFCEGQWKQSL